MFEQVKFYVTKVLILTIILLGISLFSGSPYLASEVEYNLNKTNDIITQKTLPFGKEKEICKISNINRVNLGSDSIVYHVVLQTKTSQITLPVGRSDGYEVQRIVDDMQGFINSSQETTKVYRFKNERMFWIFLFIFGLSFTRLRARNRHSEMYERLYENEDIFRRL